MTTRRRRRAATPDHLGVLLQIGRIETPWATPEECPRNGRQLHPAPVCRVVVGTKWWPGLEGLDSFSHLIVLYRLHLGKEPLLTVVPPFDGRPRGVFATRAPCHPNQIGLSVVALEGIAGPGVLVVRNLDCVDGTPLLDIKPYLPTTDAEPDASMGWLAAPATPRGDT